MEEAEEDQKPGDKLFGLIDLSDAFGIAILPIMANLLLFAYYMGYFRPFRLPTQFITFSLMSVFTVTVALFLLALVPFSCANTIGYKLRFL
jgi:hypothetical protein